jgi:hypothetical protein
MREKSLKIDANDQKALRRSRHQHLGICVSSEFYQPCPMFFTREGSQLNVIGKYRGASVFVVMNGPSLKDLDLDKLNQAGVVTYGVNNGPKTFRPDLWTCVDPPDRFLKSIWLDPKIQKIVPMDFFEKNLFDSEQWKSIKKRVGECPNVMGFRRNEKFMAQRFLWEDTINWGNHKDYGGGRSVFIATMRIIFLLGFRKVYLLGCDFNMNAENTYHFEENRTNSAVKCNTNTYKKMNDEYFAQLKPEFELENFEVYNCNPNSGLTVFPHKPFDEAIQEATGFVGNVDAERTYGMYTDTKNRETFKNDPKGLAQVKEATPAPEVVEKKVEKPKEQPQPIQQNKPKKTKRQDPDKPKLAPEFANYVSKKGSKKPSPVKQPVEPVEKVEEVEEENRENRENREDTKREIIESRRKKRPKQRPFNDVVEQKIQGSQGIKAPENSAFTSTLSRRKK